MGESKSPTPYHIQIIDQHFGLRKSKNPKYSLTAYARDLKLSTSYLHRALNGQRKLSPTTAVSLAKKLKLDNLTTFKFVDSATESHAGTRVHTIDESRDHSRALDENEFSTIVPWENLATLELCDLDHFDVNEVSVSRSLGISPDEAGKILCRLQRLGLIEKHPTYGYRKRQTWVHTPNRAKSSPPLREHQKSLLMKASLNMDTIPIEQRANFGAMYAIDPDKIPEAKELMDRFLLELQHLLQGTNRTAVYAAGIFLTPLSSATSQNIKTRKTS